MPVGVFGGRASGEDQEKTPSRNFDVKLWHMTSEDPGGRDLTSQWITFSSCSSHLSRLFLAADHASSGGSRCYKKVWSISDVVLTTMAPRFLRNLVPHREKREAARPLLVVLAGLSWTQWALFFSG